jgi:hypothetical protein
MKANLFLDCGILPILVKKVNQKGMKRIINS